MHFLNIDIAPVLNQIVKAVIIIVAGFVGKLTKDYILPRIKKQYAVDAVKYIEQKYGKDIEMKGKKKFDAAAQWMSDRLAKIHIKVTPEEIEGYIESAVHELTNQVKKDLNKTISKPAEVVVAPAQPASLPTEQSK